MDIETVGNFDMAHPAGISENGRIRITDRRGRATGRPGAAEPGFA
jgi:hypothetical protein